MKRKEKRETGGGGGERESDFEETNGLRASGLGEIAATFKKQSRRREPAGPRPHNLCENSDSNVKDHNILDHRARRARHAVPLRSRHHIFTETLKGRLYRARGPSDS